MTGCLQNVKKTDIFLLERLPPVQYNHNKIIKLFVILSMMEHGIFLALIILRKKSQNSTPIKVQTGILF